MESIGQRIKRLRGEETQDSLSKRVGVSRVAISNWERGETKNLKGDNLIKLARCLKVEPGYIVSGSSSLKVPPPGYDNTAPAPTRSGRPIPVLNYIQAGKPREVVDDYAPGAGMAELEVDVKMAEELGLAAFALQIEGDSMEPDFVAGDHVIIDPDVAPRPGDYVVAKLENEQAATFKKYRSRGIDSAGHEMFELVALNPNYLPIQVNGVNPGFIIGTMIEHRRYRRRG